MQSLPAWAAWIEIETGSASNLACWSLPAWAAWIEIVVVFGNAIIKWTVAARMGSVD